MVVLEYASRNMKGRKIFNIGFHKTGTTSLTQFMREQGFKVLHNVSYSMQNLGLGSQSDGEEGDGEIVDLSASISDGMLDKLVREFDYFSDNPWPVLYARLDRAYPGSQFILTRRQVDSWIDSLLRHTSAQNTRMRQLIYGYGNPHQHVTRYRKVYISHNRRVQEHFSGRKNFLLIDLEDDNDAIAQRLHEFLGLRRKHSRFQSLNRGKAMRP